MFTPETDLRSSARVKVDGVASTLTLKETKMKAVRGETCAEASAAGITRTNKRPTGSSCWSFVCDQSVAEATFHGATPLLWSRAEAWSSPFVVLLLQLLSAFHPSRPGGCAAVDARLALNGGRRVCAVFFLRVHHARSSSLPRCLRLCVETPPQRRRREGT